MATPYVFSDEVPTLLTVASNDIMLLWDTSAGLMKRSTVTQVNTIIKPLARGSATTNVLGFYGQTGVDQGTMTSTAVTAVAAVVFSAGNAAGTWAWASSTEAANFTRTVRQCQADLSTLMARIESTGLVAISGN